MELALEQTGYQAIASGCIKLAEGDKLLTDIRVRQQACVETVVKPLLLLCHAKDCSRLSSQRFCVMSTRPQVRCLTSTCMALY